MYSFLKVYLSGSTIKGGWSRGLSAYKDHVFSVKLNIPKKIIKYTDEVVWYEPY